MDNQGKKELLAMLREIIRSECAVCKDDNKTACKVCAKVGTYRKAVKLICGQIRQETVVSPKIECVIRRSIIVCDDLMRVATDRPLYDNALETKEQLQAILKGKVLTPKVQ